MNAKQQIVILIPHGVQTGGPEALHQLSDSLIRQGHDARVWYVLPTDLPAVDDLFRRNGLGAGTVLKLQPRPNTVADYEKYQVRLAEEIAMTPDTCVVLAETYVHWLRYFQPCKPMVWWLSIDNAFEYLSVNDGLLQPAFAEAQRYTAATARSVSAGRQVQTPRMLSTMEAASDRL